MTGSLTNVILASIHHLIRRDLVGNRGAPPRWAPLSRALARRRHRRIRRSGLRTVIPPPSYWPMESSPPRSTILPLPPFGMPYNPRTSVDLRHLVGLPEGITPFMATGPRSALAKEGERGSPAVESLIRGMTDLTITDRLGTPIQGQIHHHLHRTR
jgi:hypothetical protein